MKFDAQIVVNILNSNKLFSSISHFREMIFAVYSESYTPRKLVSHNKCF